MSMKKSIGVALLGAMMMDGIGTMSNENISGFADRLSSKKQLMIYHKSFGWKPFSGSLARHGIACLLSQGWKTSGQIKKIEAKRQSKRLHKAA